MYSLKAEDYLFNVPFRTEESKRDLKTSTCKYGLSFKPAVPNVFGTRDRFHGRQFFHGLGWGDGSGDGERQMKLCLLARHPPPAVWSGS